MMKRIALGVMPLAIMLSMSLACAARTPAAENGVENGGMMEPARVTVINRSFERVTMYVYRGAERHRLGAVSPGLEETFQVPSTLMAGLPRLRFTAETIGRQVLASVTETIRPGIHLELIVH